MLDVDRDRALFPNAALLMGASYVIGCDIDPYAVHDAATERERVSGPESPLILSGFPEWDTPAGFGPREELSLDKWRCFVCYRHWPALKAAPVR